MYKNATVKVYVPTMTKNNEGTTIKTWGYKATPYPADPADTFRADVQPARLSEAQLRSYGIDTRGADTKIMFFEKSSSIAVNNRVNIVSDFPSEGSYYYEVRGTNHWPRHGEAILVPVLGE